MRQGYTYIAAEFDRYHSGKMSEAEMHALEKAALEDPFLADALEGYAYTDKPLQDMADLKQRLLVKQEQKKIFPWLRIAAMFVLIAGIGYMAYLLNFTKEPGELATKEDDVKNIAKQIETLKKDSSLIGEDVVINNPTEKGNVLTSKENKLIAPPLKKNSDKGTETPAESMADKNLQKPVVRDFQKDLATSDEIKLNDKKSAAEVTNSDSQKSEEVVVTALGMKRAERSVSNEAAKNRQAPKTAIIDSASQPGTVWQEFTEYVQKNIRIPRDDAGKNYKGRITLSFEINKRGNPKNIKVEQSLCKPCDEEAVRLLKHGPKWKYTGEKRQVVTIEF